MMSTVEAKDSAKGLAKDSAKDLAKDSKKDSKKKELMETARREIRKLRQGANSNLERLITQATMFADNVLKRLVAHTLNKPINDLFDDYVKTRGEILLDVNKTKYTLKLDIVPKDYMLDLKQFKNHAGVRERMEFLLNMVKVLYCPIKDHMKEWAKKNDTTFNYVLQIGLNTTLFIDQSSKKRIGIILTKV